MSGSTDDDQFLVHIHNNSTQETKIAILSCHAATTLANQRYGPQSQDARVVTVDFTRQVPVSATTLDQLCYVLKVLSAPHQVVIIRPPHNSNITFEIHKMKPSTGETPETHEPITYPIYSADDTFITLLEKALEQVRTIKKDGFVYSSMEEQGGGKSKRKRR